MAKWKRAGKEFPHLKPERAEKVDTIRASRSFEQQVVDHIGRAVALLGFLNWTEIENVSYALHLDAMESEDEDRRTLLLMSEAVMGMKDDEEREVS